MTLYRKYLKLMSDTPAFFEKYYNLEILKRLKDVSLQCGMDYASPYAYQFAFYISRFDHSLGTAKLTYKLTDSKEASLAALFHDASTPVFSHVIDFMNGDFINQESTEEKLSEVLSSSKELYKCLQEDGISLDDIINFKKFSEVDLDRPKMCADRLDNVICNGMNWCRNLTLEEALKIVTSTKLYLNEDNEKEIGFTREDTARKVCEITNLINELTHTKEDYYMMNLLASIVRHILDKKYCSYNDLFVMTETGMFRLIEDKLLTDKVLASLWYEFKNVRTFPEVPKLETKIKVVNPLVLGKRLY